MTKEEAIEILNNTAFFGRVQDDIDNAIDMAIRALKNEQTADVKPIVYGKWIKRYVITDTKTIELNVCSECNEEFSHDAETGISMDNYNICPNCGANMRKESEEEE